MAHMNTTSPTSPDYYENHNTEALEAIAANSAAAGQHIAANYGADHLLAVEHAAIWAAVTHVLIARQVAA